MSGHQIHQAGWQEGQEGTTFDLRVTCTPDGQIKMSSLQEPGYEDMASTPEEATNTFKRLVQKGQQQTG